MKDNKERFPTRVNLVVYFLKGNLHFFVFSVLFASFVSVFDLINPKIIGFTVDSVIGSRQPELTGIPAFVLEKAGGISYLRNHLFLVAAAVVLIALFAASCRYLFILLNSMGAEKLVRRMRDSLFEHILHLPYAWHGTQQTGDIIQRCTSDVEMVKRFLAEQMTGLLRVILLLVLAIWFMAGIHPMLTLAAGVFLPVIVGYSLFFHRRIGASFEKVDIHEGKLSAIAQENLTGVRVVRAFGREQYERERFEAQNREYTKMWVDLMRLMSMFFSVGDLISGLQILTVTALGAVFCVRGALSAGDYIAFISYNAMLTWPVRGLGRIISEMSKAGISIDRIRFIMNSPVEKDRENALTPPMDGDICFEHVTFAYEGSEDKILDDVSFTVKAGSTLGILGSTGSGKSTLMQLLDRLYSLDGEDAAAGGTDAAAAAGKAETAAADRKETGKGNAAAKPGKRSGRITVGGVDIADMKASWVRGNIGFVLQEPFLFSRTLAENIAIAVSDEGPAHKSNKTAGRNRASYMDEVRRAAKIASLDETVRRFTKGYETFVGERGVTLSGGQKQRTAIAQMLIRKPPIMVFDDSLSAVDAQTDAKIRHALEESTGSSTRILIGHRITTLMNADQIIVMDRGKITERGTHEELLKADGIYRKIYDLQTNAYEQ